LVTELDLVAALDNVERRVRKRVPTLRRDPAGGLPEGGLPELDGASYTGDCGVVPTPPCGGVPPLLGAQWTMVLSDAQVAAPK
jgi:hypothetical protein